MTIAFWCVLVAGFLPYFGTLTAKVGGDSFDNRNPRDWLNAQSGFRKRANAAQHNSFEAFPFFAAAVIIAFLVHAPQQRVDILAIIFIAARVVYLVCYLADWHWARSLVWMLGWVACLTIFLLGA